MTPNGELIDVGDDVTIWAQSVGDGPAVLLSAGMGMPPAAWSFSGLPESLLDAGFRVITYAARGVAPSSAPPAPYAVHDLAADAAEVLDHFDIDEAILVGYSMGCYLSQALFDVWGGSIRGLALVGGLRSSAIGEVVNEMKLNLISQLGQVPPSVTLFEQLMTTLSPAALRDSAQVAGWRSILAGSPEAWTSPDGAHGQTTASQSWMRAGEPTVERLAAISCPTLVVSFGDDVYFPTSGSQEASTHIPNSTFVVVEGEGHAGLMLDQQHRGTSHVVDFCVGLRS